MEMTCQERASLTSFTSSPKKDAIAAEGTAPRYFHLGKKVPGLLHVLEVACGWYKARTTAAPHLPSTYWAPTP